MSKKVDKRVITGEASTKKLLEGIDLVHKAVSSTLGPNGKLVIIQRSFGGPRVTKDGVSVAKEVSSSDRFVQLGVKLFQEVSSKTDKLAGDGTTTSVVLCNAIIKQAFKELKRQRSTPTKLSVSIREATEDAIEFLQQSSIKISEDNLEQRLADLEKVATISSNNDSFLGKMIAEAVNKAGDYGVISVESTSSFETKLEFDEGIKIDSGFSSPYYITHGGECILENPAIFIYDGRISASERELCMFLLNFAKEKLQRPLLVLCDDIDNDAAFVFVYNKMKMIMISCVVKAPIFGSDDSEKADTIADRAAALQCLPYSPKIHGFKALVSQPERFFGTCKRALIDQKNCLLVGSSGDIKDRVEAVKEKIKRAEEESVSKYKLDKIKERYSRLTNGASVIKVGGSSESEVEEKKDRIVDAVNATRVALSKGYLPGGGVSFLKAASQLKKGGSSSGEVILCKALEAPFKKIAENSGFNPELIIEEIEKAEGKCPGFDALKGQIVGDIVEAGIIDSAGVCIKALELASSIAQICLTTRALIVSSDNDDKG